MRSAATLVAEAVSMKVVRRAPATTGRGGTDDFRRLVHRALQNLPFKLMVNTHAVGEKHFSLREWAGDQLWETHLVRTVFCRHLSAVRKPLNRKHLCRAGQLRERDDKQPNRPR
jgi:hypothetical protein